MMRFLRCWALAISRLMPRVKANAPETRLLGHWGRIEEFAVLMTPRFHDFNRTGDVFVARNTCASQIVEAPEGCRDTTWQKRKAQPGILFPIVSPAQRASRVP